MRKKLIQLSLIIYMLLSMTACAAYMLGYTEPRAVNQYMKVDATNKNFGFKRVSYNVKSRGPTLKEFIKEKGMPDYLYEFREGGRAGFIFYYLQSDTAYVFKESSWRLDSASLVDIRCLNQFEKKRFGLPPAETHKRKE
jgi:hypothetical protein